MNPTPLQLTLSEVTHGENEEEHNLIGLHASLKAGILRAI